MLEMFKSKKRKALEENQRLEAEKKLAEQQKKEKEEKELEARINIKRTLRQMKSQCSKFDAYKNDYIIKARKAMSVNDMQTYKLAKAGIKLCLAKQKYLDSMVASFEVALQMNDMNKLISGFVKGLKTISEDMKNITSSIDMQEAQIAFEKALAKNEGQYVALEAMLDSATGELESLDGSDYDIADDEIDKMVANSIPVNDQTLSKDLDMSIENLEKELN